MLKIIIRMRNYIFTIILGFGIAFGVKAINNEVNTSVADNVTNSASQESISVDSIPQPTKKLNFFQKIGNYFKNSNKENNDKKFDFSVIGGPAYSSDTKFSIGLVGAGVYRIDRSDLELQPSSVSIYGNVSTIGFWLVGVRGNNFFPHDKYRLNYDLYIYSNPTNFWGIGYYNGVNDDNFTRMSRFQAQLKIDFLCRLAKNLYIGPSVQWDYINSGMSSDFTNYDEMMRHYALYDGMDFVTRQYGVGLILSYDSRDNIKNAYKGIFTYARQMFRPSWLGNKYKTISTEFEFDIYKQLWKTGVLAWQVRGEFNFGDPHWAMMAMIGNSYSMRGYYEGRYRDKHKVETQLELRQRIWKRFGATVWVGTGSAFHDTETFKKFLPNFGVGVRWEFKHRMNVRLDVGYAKGNQIGFIFNINEAF